MFHDAMKLEECTLKLRKCDALLKDNLISSVGINNGEPVGIDSNGKLDDEFSLEKHEVDDTQDVPEETVPEIGGVSRMGNSDVLTQQSISLENSDEHRSTEERLSPINLTENEAPPKLANGLVKAENNAAMSEESEPPVEPIGLHCLKGGPKQMKCEENSSEDEPVKILIPSLSNFTPSSEGRRKRSAAQLASVRLIADIPLRVPKKQRLSTASDSSKSNTVSIVKSAKKEPCVEPKGNSSSNNVLPSKNASSLSKKVSSKSTSKSDKGNFVGKSCTDQTDRIVEIPKPLRLSSWLDEVANCSPPSVFAVKSKPMPTIPSFQLPAHSVQSVPYIASPPMFYDDHSSDFLTPYPSFIEKSSAAEEVFFNWHTASDKTETITDHDLFEKTKQEDWAVIFAAPPSPPQESVSEIKFEPSTGVRKVINPIRLTDTDVLCSYCKKIVKKASFRAHVNTWHQKIGPYRCGICDKGFVRKGDAQVHMKMHDNPGYSEDISVSGFSDSLSTTAEDSNNCWPRMEISNSEFPIEASDVELTNSSFMSDEVPLEATQLVSVTTYEEPLEEQQQPGETDLLCYDEEGLLTPFAMHPVVRQVSSSELERQVLSETDVREYLIIDDSSINVFTCQYSCVSVLDEASLSPQRLHEVVESLFR
ncbi:unnamed protein product [Notodromas monacha]|uniref:C2H2-type domain-containing protein n=1 Tax=Notodromas monacha TaxID=399045 RepID=A0A7R9GJW5_9CRUS|nr:unnamed protein product [Notodromas monacha]CAG0923994.1 unnamed protein product [Notodromas monacha]